MSGPSCPLCGADAGRPLGIRGNREYPGADPRAEPHLVTDVLRCARCDFIYIGSLNDEATALEEKHYSDENAYPGMGGGAAAAALARVRLIEKHAPRGNLLDVGAGKGEFVKAASMAGWDALGVEPSANLARYATTTGANVQQGYVEGPHPIPPNGFDVITLIHVLEHVAAPRELLRSLRAQLGGAGVIFVEVPNCDSYLLRFVEAYYRVRGREWSPRLSPCHPPFHQRGFTKRSLAFALSTSGYRIEEIGTFTGFDRDCALSGSTRAVDRLGRRVLSRAFDLLGNRELLYAVASPEPPTGPG